MRGLRVAAWGALYVALLLTAYRFAVPRLESAAYVLYHEQVVKRLARDRAALLSGPEFLLGLYRPELPYHFDKVYEVEEGLDARVSVISWYQAWGDGEEHRLDRDLLDNIARGGFTPMITWEPWVSAFDAYRGQTPDAGLALIARGEFDGYVHAWAREAARFGRPMFLRFAHEVSNPWYAWSDRYGNTEEMFLAAWQRVHGIFREEGARNVAFVWNPYEPRDTAFWPGDAYVDWIGLDVFNFGPLSEDGFRMEYANVMRPLHEAVRGFGKPILLAEVGSVAAGGDKNQWYRDMFHSLSLGEFAGVRGVVIFDHPSGHTPTGIPVDLSMTSDPEVYSVIRGEDLTRLGLSPRGK